MLRDFVPKGLGYCVYGTWFERNNICWANVVPTPIIMYLVYCMTCEDMVGQCCPNVNGNPDYVQEAYVQKAYLQKQ